jgi:hypothetical protein
VKGWIAARRRGHWVVLEVRGQGGMLRLLLSVAYGAKPGLACFSVCYAMLLCHI